MKSKQEPTKKKPLRKPTPLERIEIDLFNDRESFSSAIAKASVYGQRKMRDRAANMLVRRYTGKFVKVLAATIRSLKIEP